MEGPRPQTARAQLGRDGGGGRKGSTSPYNALPGNASALGLHVRPKTAHVGAAAGAADNSRTMYVRAPRPPGGLREYAPLRPRAHSSGQVQAGHGQGAWQEDTRGTHTTHNPPHDTLRDDGRPTSARVAAGTSNPSRKPPPMSARGRMQSDRQDSARLGRVPSGGGYDSNNDLIYEDEEEHGEAVAIFPAPNRQIGRAHV